MLIQANTEALVTKNRAGDVPLHMAVERKGSPNLLQLLIDNDPRALMIANQKGDLPIHVACRFEAPLAIFQILIEAGKEGLTVPNAGGDLPLHVACAQRGIAQSVLQLLVAEGTDAVVTFNSDGNLPLHMACGAPTPTATSMKHGPASTNTSAPLAVLELLTERWADSIHTPNAEGRLPLHVACSTKHASLAVVSFLLQRGPKDVRVTDAAGYLPLHVACAHTHASLAVVQRLVHAWADGGPTDGGADGGGDEGGDDTELEQAAVVNERIPPPSPENSLGGVKITTPDGNTALHLACYYKAPLDVVQFLVHRWPQSVYSVNEKNDTPLQLVNHPHRGVPSQDVKAWLSNIGEAVADSNGERQA